jgi:hypothetical protein
MIRLFQKRVAPEEIPAMVKILSRSRYLRHGGGREQHECREPGRSHNKDSSGFRLAEIVSGFYDVKNANSQLTAATTPRTARTIGRPINRMMKGTSKAIPAPPTQDIRLLWNVHPSVEGRDTSITSSRMSAGRLWSGAMVLTFVAGRSGWGCVIPKVQDGGSLAGKESARTLSTARSAASLCC